MRYVPFDIDADLLSDNDELSLLADHDFTVSHPLDVFFCNFIVKEILLIPAPETDVLTLAFPPLMLNLGVTDALIVNG